MSKALEALLANHKHHQDYDDHGGYKGSELEQQNLEAIATLQSAQGGIEYLPGEWYQAKNRDDLEAFFTSRIPSIREAAREHGYAIGVHGSLRRDLDLIAVPWREGASDKDVLAHAIAVAACGITREGAHQWEDKPLGRVATSISCCWPSWYNEAGAGHIDLSVMGCADRAIVPLVPTETQWGGLARDIVLAFDMNGNTPFKLMQVLTNLGREIPQWFRDELKDEAPLHVISKGTRVTLIYRAMVEAARQQKG